MNPFKLIKLGMNALRKGERLSDKGVWVASNGLVLITLLTGFLVSLDELAKATGINFGMSDTEIEQVARYIVSTFMFIATFVIPMINRHVGLPAKKDPPQ